MEHARQPRWLAALAWIVVVSTVVSVGIAAERAHAGAEGPKEASQPATLACTGRPLPLAAPGLDGLAVTCGVTGAGSADTSFRLVAALTAQSGETRTVDPLCEGKLQEGAGTCRGNVIAPVPYWTGSLIVTGTVQPSGSMLGPAPITRIPQPGSLTPRGFLPVVAKRGAP